MKKFKRVAAMVLAVALCLGLLPNMAQAAPKRSGARGSKSGAELTDKAAWDPYLTFTSEESFTLAAFKGSQTWDGVLEYSVDAEKWTVWDGTTTLTSEDNGEAHVLYLRGTGNSVITYGYPFALSGKSGIACTGSIETLLDYAAVAAGGHPVMADDCYSFMFDGCTALTSAPALPATALANNCYRGMFSGCTALVSAPALPATTLTEYCYTAMFYGCTALTAAPALPATTLAGNCYKGMFYGCTALTAAPALPAVTLADSCYWEMFRGCTALKLSTKQTEEYPTAYRVPIEGTGTDANGALDGMFAGTGGEFQGTPEINTTYYLHTSNSIVSPQEPGDEPETPAWDPYLTFTSEESFTLAAPGGKTWDGTLEWSFDPTNEKSWAVWDGKEALASAEADKGVHVLYLRGTDNHVISNGNSWVLEGKAGIACTGSIETLLDYAAVAAGGHPVMAEGCYAGMFDGCTALVSAPALPATTLADDCYNSMFRGCTALTSAPALPATTLADDCYNSMFRGCTALMLSTKQTEEYPTAYRVPIEGTGTDANGALHGMFEETGGEFQGTPNINTTYYLHTSNSIVSPQEPGDEPETPAWDPYLTFTSEESFTLAAFKGSQTWDGVLEYSVDAERWTVWDGTTTLTSEDNGEAHVLYLRGTGNSVITQGYPFALSGKSGIACTGSIETLLDYAAVAAGGHPVMAEGCYAGMFDGCTALTAAPELPATTLAEGCYAGMFNGCTALTTAPALPATELATECYREMFRGCTALTAAPALPATTLAEYCYTAMFYGCTALTAAPALPAVTLAEGCYAGMFDGCTALVSAPALPATTLADDCYNSMFRGCTALKLSTKQTEEYPTAYRVPIEGTGTDENGALHGMFEETGGEFQGTPEINTTYYLHTSNSIVSPQEPETPEEPETPAWDPYLTFTSANSFTLSAPARWNGTLEYSTDAATWTAWDGTQITAGANGEDYVLYLRGTGNTVITGGDDSNTYRWTLTGSDIACSGSIETLLDYAAVEAENHPAMDAWCFARMFYNCAALTTAPELPATTLANYCYRSIFNGCTSLITAPELPAATMAVECYRGMFYGCTSLTAAPELPATTLANNCYEAMFQDCTALTAAPELPATKLANCCYTRMFRNCTSLTAAPELPATTLANGCYTSMFKGCTSLTTAPELPATTMASECYNSMFQGCTSLTATPALPATTLASYCYISMFSDCTSLTAAPELPATTLADYCYYQMFYGCTGIKLSATQTAEYTTPYRVPAAGTGTDATSALTDMFTSTGGPFTGTPSINTTYYLWNPAAGNYLTFSSAAPFTLATANGAKNWNGTLEYSTDGLTWTVWDGTTTLASSVGNTLYLRGTGNTVITGSEDGRQWVLTGSGIACTGNIENLLDYATVAAGNHPAMANHCYRYLFNGCTALTSAPELPATTLTEYCYTGMFQGCTSLTEAPELPATTLATSCYRNMFIDCTKLVNVPATLPATTLAESCYRSMFNGCRSLATAPALPATTLANECYQYMFAYCALTSAPELPATTLAADCYNGMFCYCTALTSGPELPATTLATNCYYQMYYGCTALTTAPELPATTLTSNCYFAMFQGCTSLTTAPAVLPATTLAASCYNSMFEGCTSLTAAPELPATTLANYCYTDMFYQCSALTAPPALPATTLADYCYWSMFQSCTSLTTLPALPATTLTTDCYRSMFNGCTGVKLSATKTAEYSTPYRIPARGTGTDETGGRNSSMFASTGGPFKGTPDINTVYYLYGPDSYYNEYVAYDLTISSSVSGNQASRDKYFKYTVTITNAGADADLTVDMSGAALAPSANEATSYGASVMAAANGADDNADVEGLQWRTDANGTVTKDVYLQHGQTVVIHGLPGGAGYTVTGAAEDYLLSAENGSLAGRDGTHAGVCLDMTAAFTGSKNGVVPTGVSLPVLPGAALLTASALSLFLLLRRRKKEEETGTAGA